MSGSTRHQKGDDDTLRILITSFKVHYSTTAPPSSPYPNVRPPSLASSTAIYPAPITATHFRYSSRSKRPSESLPSDALGSPHLKGYLSYPWPDHQNGIPGRTAKEGCADYLGEFVKQQRQDRRENIIHLCQEDAYLLEPYAIIFRITSTISKLLSGHPVIGRRGADLSAPLAYKRLPQRLSILGNTLPPLLRTDPLSYLRRRSMLEPDDDSGVNINTSRVSLIACIPLRLPCQWRNPLTSSLPERRSTSFNTPIREYTLFDDRIRCVEAR